MSKIPLKRKRMDASLLEDECILIFDKDDLESLKDHSAFTSFSIHEDAIKFELKDDRRLNYLMIWRRVKTSFYFINDIESYIAEMNITNAMKPKKQKKIAITDGLFYVGQNTLKCRTWNGTFDDSPKGQIKFYKKNYSAPYQLTITYACKDDDTFLVIQQKSHEEIILRIDESENGFDGMLHRMARIGNILCEPVNLSYSKQLPNNQIEFHFTYDIYLSSKLEKNSVLENPSNVLKNGSSMADIHTLMTKYYFSLNPAMCVRAENQIKLDDEFLDSKNVSSKNENLFDMVHMIHQNELRAKVKNMDMESIEQLFVNKNSMLRPTLRQYQINAIRWMLKRENFTFDKSENTPVLESTPSKKRRRTTESEIENEYSDEVNDNDLHSLYIKIVDKNLKTIYYHRYYGFYLTKKPMKGKKLPGGILADEMGLGKTLEILGTILMNPRIDFPEQIIEPDMKKIKFNKNKTFSCLCGDAPSSFKMNVDRPSKKFKSERVLKLNEISSQESTTSNVSIECEDEKVIYQCTACAAWTHIECVKYQGPQKDFLCLHCCTQVQPISSKCTLIVTPTVIKHQWLEEIKKHVNAKLNVLIYNGCNQTFIQPKDLAQMDICITTYDILSKELAHVFAIENMKNLRHTKRFMNVPSPLVCIEWWRICLDEAQMVHNSNSNCAEMANRMQAVNRWCVSGTPIGRSIADLHGLFTFIREDPYYEKNWFNQLLYYPYIKNERMPMAQAVSEVLWRTSKQNVEDQIKIPQQTEKIFWLNFSPFENHLYDRLIEAFRVKRKVNLNEFNPGPATENGENSNDNLNSLEKFFESYSKDARLDEMDRTMIDKILTPILDMRLACDHPQLVLRKRTFMTQDYASKKDKLFSMEKSMNLLIKKTKNEAEQFYRNGIMNSNAIAGILLLKNKLDDSCDFYQKILDSEKEFNFQIRMDNLQKIHATFNYIHALEHRRKEKNEPVTENFIENIQKLQVDLKEMEKLYTFSFEEKKMKEELKLIKKSKEINEKLVDKFESIESEFIDGLSSIEKCKTKYAEFWERLGDVYPTTFTASSQVLHINQYSSPQVESVKNLSYQICNKTIRSMNELKFLFVSELEKVIQSRAILFQELQIFYADSITSEMVEKCAVCHLRNTGSRLKHEYKCNLCRCDKLIRDYGKQLFSNSDDVVQVLKKKHQELNEESDTEDNNVNLGSRSDLERLFRLVNKIFSKDDALKKNTVARDLIENYIQLKDEFKFCTQFWINSSTLINAYDELDMTKLRMELTNPAETKNSNRSANLVPENQLDNVHAQFVAGKNQAYKDLKKKFGQLVFLQNLAKSNSLKVNEENEETCPICQCNLGFKWYVLSCGHSYCVDCTNSLEDKQSTHRGSYRCALCRHLSSKNDRYLVSTITVDVEDEIKKPTLIQQVSDKFDLDKTDYLNYNENELKSIKIKGESNSAKVMGIVKCLVKIIKNDPKAKCIVFSEHITMLELIKDLLKDNTSGYKLIKDNQSLQKHIQEFKKDKAMNILLMPYSFGANGLNLVEATHVLLVEPTLNRSQEVQAIGRVHRIGQTKPTTVYRFIIRNTIEELVYNLFKSNTSYSSQTQILNENEPNSSSAFAKAELLNDTAKSKNILTINDIKDLFKKL